MNEQLKSQLKGLQHPSALLRRQATLGVFALLLKSQHPQQHEVAQEVLLTCLTDQHPVRMMGISTKSFVWPAALHVTLIMAGGSYDGRNQPRTQTTVLPALHGLSSCV